MVEENVGCSTVFQFVFSSNFDCLSKALNLQTLMLLLSNARPFICFHIKFWFFYAIFNFFRLKRYILWKVLVDFLFVLILHQNTPLSNVVNNHYNYLLFINFQTLIDFIRLRFRFVKEIVIRLWGLLDLSEKKMWKLVRHWIEAFSVVRLDHFRLVAIVNCWEKILMQFPVKTNYFLMSERSDFPC